MDLRIGEGSDMRKTEKRKIVYVVVLAALIFAWTLTIFAQSAKSGEESTDDTNKVMEIIEEVAESVGLDAEVSTHFVRKTAHFLEYFVLGVLTSLLFLTLGGGWRFCGGFIYAVSVAFCDEFAVQRFSEGRAPQFTDVLIDSAGALSGLLVILAVFVWVKARRNTAKCHDTVNPC